MIDVYNKYGGVVISGVRIANKKDVSRYGIADVDKIAKGVFKIKRNCRKT